MKLIFNIVFKNLNKQFQIKYKYYKIVKILKFNKINTYNIIKNNKIY